ncbi:glutamyl-tRNA reductase [Arthrobacter stackebrandtii]|uniref:Glutamyl-tRNA reductase n=1 Tax=Arthrobacter stackebrandtii TaxID=272161 RepID=A0ABS4YXR6_9MICC|nr:glutamyl-tRNA reductase [Arthrobacter stackebrandtii]MBP2413604.1 glutamyl-tRNA reductase [Arthrobacter stackebrandtii]
MGVYHVEIVVLFSLVASHTDLDLETVARLSSGASEVSSELVAAQNAVAGLVTLATCNRYELYLHARSADDVGAARSAAVEAVSRYSGLPAAQVSDALATLQEDAVPRHLFSVSTGLDSAVVGEREIAGQVRRALSEAQDQGVTTPQLVRLFQAAAKTAKDVGSQTALGSRGMSIVSVALDLASAFHAAPSQDAPPPAGALSAAPCPPSGDAGPLSGMSAVLFGTGAYAGAAMAQLAQRGCTDISVYSSSGRADIFTASRGGTALNDDTLPGALANATLLVGCSGSDHQVTKADLAQLRHDNSPPLTVIDLALSHDFTPDIAELPGVELLTLETVRQAAPAEQEETLAQASALVTEATSSFGQAQNARSLDHAIVALRRHTMAVLDDELAKVRKQHGCSAATAEVEFAMRRMVKQLLHVPTVRAKELAAAGDTESYIAALDVLYGLKPTPEIIGSAVSAASATKAPDAGASLDGTAGTEATA